MKLAKAALIWTALAAAIGVPVALAAASDLLQWRGPVYIVAGFLAQPDPPRARVTASDSARMRGLHFIGVLLTPKRDTGSSVDSQDPVERRGDQAGDTERCPPVSSLRGTAPSRSVVQSWPRVAHGRLRRATA